jgi:hypothetical protein
MTIDCQWIDKNLEALFNGNLSQEDRDRAQQHIENCRTCGNEVAALNAIDPLIKKHFQNELGRVRRASSPTVAKGRLAALGSAVLIAVSLLLVVILRPSHPDSAVPNVQPAAASVAARPATAQPPQSVDGTTPEVERSKPVEIAAGDAAQSQRALPASGGNAPEFLVSDVAGYSRTLDDYRGHVFVLSVLRQGDVESASNLERLYKVFEANPKFRFLAVSSERLLKPANTTFPIAYNRGSKLFGASPGDFVLLDEAGSIQLRGSLVKDFERLQKTLQEK